MTVKKTSRLPLESLQARLEKIGWDVNLDDILTAWRGDAHGRWQLSVDKGGRVHLRRSALAKKPQGRTLKKEKHIYHLHEEGLTLLDAITTISTVAEFLPVVETMTEMLLSHPSER